MNPYRASQTPGAMHEITPLNSLSSSFSDNSLTSVSEGRVHEDSEVDYSLYQVSTASMEILNRKDQLKLLVDALYNAKSPIKRQRIDKNIIQLFNSSFEYHRRG